MLHRVKADQGARAAQARLAVHGDAPRLGLANLQELADDGIVGSGAVREVKVLVSDSVLCEPWNNYQFCEILINL